MNLNEMSKFIKRLEDIKLARGKRNTISTVFGTEAF